MTERHTVDPSRRRHIEDPDEYQRGRRDGDTDTQPEREQGGKKLWLALPVLLLALAADTPRSGPLGRRGQTRPPEADKTYERDEMDPPPRKLTADIPESELDGWKEGTR